MVNQFGLCRLNSCCLIHNQNHNLVAHLVVVLVVVAFVVVVFVPIVPFRSSFGTGLALLEYQ
jgi:uncharacterized membrane protein